MLNILLLFLSGCGVGFLGGMFGASGWILLVPLFLMFFQSNGVSSLVAAHLAIGSSLLILVFSSAVSAFRFHRAKQVVWAAIPSLAAAGVAGAALGSLVGAGLDGKTLLKAFAVVVFVAALRLLAEVRKPKAIKGPASATPGYVLTGFCAGIFSAITGTDASLLSIPVLYSRFLLPLQKATGTSHAAMAVIGLTGLIGSLVLGSGRYLLPPGVFGFVDIIHALPVLAGALPCYWPGNALAGVRKITFMRRVYAACLFVLALKIFLF